MGHFAITRRYRHAPKPRVDQLTGPGRIQSRQQLIALRKAVIPRHKAAELVFPRASPKVFDKGLITLGELMHLRAPAHVCAVSIQQEWHPPKGGVLPSIAPFTHYGLLPDSER